MGEQETLGLWVRVQDVVVAGVNRKRLVETIVFVHCETRKQGMTWNREQIDGGGDMRERPRAEWGRKTKSLGCERLCKYYGRHCS